MEEVRTPITPAFFAECFRQIATEMRTWLKASQHKIQVLNQALRRSRSPKTLRQRTEGFFSEIAAAVPALRPFATRSHQSDAELAEARMWIKDPRYLAKRYMDYLMAISARKFVPRLASLLLTACMHGCVVVPALRHRLSESSKRLLGDAHALDLLVQPAPAIPPCGRLPEPCELDSLWMGDVLPILQATYPHARWRLDAGSALSFHRNDLTACELIAGLLDDEQKQYEQRRASSVPTQLPADLGEAAIGVIADRSGKEPKLIWLRFYLDTNPNATQREISDKAKKRGYTLSKSSINAILEREKWIGHPPRGKRRKTESKDPQVMGQMLSDKNTRKSF